MSINVTSQPGNNGIKPEAPTGQSATAVAGTASNSAGGATVSFTPSTNPGKGAANYIATSSPGGFTASAASSPITYNSGVLSIGNNYTFTIVKQSGSGVDSDPSSATNSITAFTIPTAPTITVARQASQTLRISLSAGANANGSAITSYQYRIKTSAGAYGSYVTLSGTTGPWDIGSLTNGTTYVVQVRAVNSAGTGDPSNEPSAFPYTTPGTVSPSAARTASQQVTVSWSAPSNGGESIDAYYYRYKVSASADSSYSAWTSTTSLSAVVGSLTNGTQYTFQVYAENAAGAGGTGSATATPYTTPSSTISAADRINENRATLNGSISSDGGSAVTSVTFYYRRKDIGSYETIAGVDGGSGTWYANIHRPDWTSNAIQFYMVATNAAGAGGASAVQELSFWTLQPEQFNSVGDHAYSVPTITPRGGSQITPSIYYIALVGGGGGCGAYSGGGGGQLKSYDSATCTNSNGSITVRVGGGGAGWSISMQSPEGGASSQIFGTNSTLVAPGGTPGNGATVSFPASSTIYTREYDGGASADNTTVYIGGNLQYAAYNTGGSKPQSIGYYGGGGGGGAGGHGGNGSVVASNPFTGTGGAGGAAASAHGLNSVGAGGAGWGSQGSGTATGGAGAGGDAGDPNVLISYGEGGTGGAVRFHVYKAP